jgi:hypothetical protein
MIDAKQSAGTNDSFIYNKHLGNVYLKWFYGRKWSYWV